MQRRQMVSRKTSNDDVASSLHLEHNWLPLSLAPMSHPVETCPASLCVISDAQHPLKYVLRYVMRGPLHKGRRLCFIAVITGKDQSLQDEDCAPDPHQQAELLIETVDIFEGGKQAKDYHGMFCHDCFVQWMAKLLQCLKDRNISNCLIVMDNAKYHKVLPASTPKKGNKKEALLKACQQYGIAVSLNAARPIVWEHLSEHIKKSVIPVVVEMARSEGHDVVYTPPHHSDLQPIEIVWAIVKGAVGRQYTTSTNFADIRTRLDEAFRDVQSSTAQGCIDVANKQLLELKNHLDTMDAQNESSDGGDERNSDSDSD